ncbi:PAMP-induced secreted peptide 2 [Melia azedarach]|uniref:PAMP-induced secreted peptide 2 n=1 Tax=Melia azedarach TaxID=155640 RepID=A0ACC1XXS4_MELAZ|nr:PAMP-induced secreted peptide 2 [Melia azedarach]
MIREPIKSPSSLRVAALLVLLLGSIFFEAEARRMNELKLDNSLKEMVYDRRNSLEGFSLGAIKHSGPSPDGPGHRSMNSTSKIQDSGPGSGPGHYYFSRMRH